MLVNVAEDLAASVAEGLGMALPPAQPKALEKPTVPEVKASPALSLFARPGDGSVRTRRVAILVADGVAGADVRALHEGLTAQGAVPRLVVLSIFLRQKGSPESKPVDSPHAQTGTDKAVV